MNERDTTTLQGANSIGAPAWLGIGAMRSGTTFFADCLRQHSALDFASNGHKEQRRMAGLGRNSKKDAEYLAGFRDSAVLRGEFSPRYLWLPQTPAIANGLLSPNAPIIVVLRDPVDRYLSHQRLAASKRSRGYVRNPVWKPGPAQGIGQLIGNYADHLRSWLRYFPQSQFELFTFEEVTLQTSGACERVWSRLGLQSEPFNVAKARRYAAPESATWEWRPGVKEGLMETYARQLEMLESDWGLPFRSWIDRWES